MRFDECVYQTSTHKSADFGKIDTTGVLNELMVITLEALETLVLEINWLHGEDCFIER